ncbi:lysostaphin resistance A-like protein [Streptomyces noursei]|uniref:CPBP family intramembrane glutamic endopeptidase n=1 Tax=Streptomyces noursei TaxID=1971 RepID=UPI003410AC82
MEPTRKPMSSTTAGARPSRIVERLLADRHSLPLSIALHLAPGVLIVAVYLFIAEPLVKSIGYPPFLGWAVAMLLALVPFELGLLLWLGRRRNGRFSVRGVVHYLDKPLPRRKLVALVIPLILWFLVVSSALTPMDNFFYESLFRWVPFEGAGGGITDVLSGYPHSVMVTALAVCIPLTGLSLPVIEELYFRGFLMARQSQRGRWAPVVSTVLFSLYHLWTPWVFLSRVVFFLPGPWFAWRKKDLRVSIGMHAGTTFLLQTFGTLALLLNLVP